MKTTFISPRGRCTGCGETRAIRKNGLIGRHTSLGACQDQCEGAGLPPMTDTTVEPSPPLTMVEHATGMSDGSMNVRPDDPDIERIYPLAVWIEHRQRDGGRVYRRRIIVVEDWEEVPRGE